MSLYPAAADRRRAVVWQASLQARARGHCALLVRTGPVPAIDRELGHATGGWRHAHHVESTADTSMCTQASILAKTSPADLGQLGCIGSGALRTASNTGPQLPPPPPPKLTCLHLRMLPSPRLSAQAWGRRAIVQCIGIGYMPLPLPDRRCLRARNPRRGWPDARETGSSQRGEGETRMPALAGAGGGGVG